MPPRFNLTYVDRDGQEKTPLCLHRAAGTHERFVGFLIEHYAGVFPVWLAPTQAMIIPIADRHVEYARQVEKRLTAEGMQVKVDDGTERMQNKIRKAQGMKIPYMLVVGDKEREADAVSLRLRTGEDLKAVGVGAFIARARASSTLTRRGSSASQTTFLEAVIPGFAGGHRFQHRVPR